MSAPNQLLSSQLKSSSEKDNQLKEAEIVSKALYRSAENWKLNHRQLSDIIGLSEATISRLKKGSYILDQKSKSWQLALLFLRSYRGLDAYMGGHKDNQIKWLNAHNHLFGNKPIDMMKDVSGLAQITHYLDYIRGQ